MKIENKVTKKGFTERKDAETQVNSKKRNVKYDTTEFTIGHLVKMFGDLKKEDDGDDYISMKFVIPDYQRNQSIWNNKKKSLFIESLLLGLPIPYIFLAELEDSAKLEIVDGLQRLSTLYTFVNGNLRLSGLEKLDKLNGFYFYDLTETTQRKLLNTSLRSVKFDALVNSLDENSDESSEMFRRDVIFARINDGGEKLNDVELRRGSFPGKLTSFIDELSEDNRFVMLTPYGKDVELRQPRFELVLRFLAYIDNYTKVGHRVSSYLDSFLIDNQNSFDEDRYRDEFSKMCDCLINCMGDDAKNVFKNLNGRVTNSRCESISVGTALALRENPKLINSANFKFVDEDKFGKLVRGDGSNNPGKLRSRIEFVKNNLLGEGAND